MNKHLSSQNIQPELPFLWSESIVAPTSRKSEPQAAPASEPLKPSTTPFSQADFKEWLDIELDIAFGRGAWLYQQLERELERERKLAAEFNKMVALQSTYR